MMMEILTVILIIEAVYLLFSTISEWLEETLTLLGGRLLLGELGSRIAPRDLDLLWERFEEIRVEELSRQVGS